MKTTYSSGISGKLLAIVMVVITVICVSLSELNAQNYTLLGRYNIEGPDSAAAMTITDNPYGLSFSNLILNTNNIVVYQYSPDAGELKTSNWGSGFNTTKNIEILIQRNGNQNFKITHISVNYWNNTPGREINVRANDVEIMKRATHASNKTSTTSIGEVYIETNPDNTIVAHIANIPAIENDDVQSIKFAAKTNVALNIKKIEIYGFINYKLYEDFGNTAIVNIAKTTGTTIADFNPLALTDFRVPGWTGSSNNQLVFAVANERAAGMLFGGTASDTAYIKSPAIDLSEAYEVTYENRARVSGNNGKTLIYDNNGLLKEETRTEYSYATVSTDGFIGSASENITFAVPKQDGSEQVIDNIVIIPTTKPALNYALQSAKALGTAAKSSSKVFTIPLKAANLTGDVTLALQSGTNFTLSGGTVAQATAEAGTDVEITFNAPETAGTYTDVLTISAAGTTDRVVTLSAISDLGTSTINLTDGSVIVTGNQLTINGHAGNKASIYNLSGATLFVQANISDNAVFTLPAKGVYLLKIEGNNSFPATTKVVIR